MKKQAIDKIHTLLDDFSIIELEAIYLALLKLTGRSDHNGHKATTQGSDRSDR